MSEHPGQVVRGDILGGMTGGGFRGIRTILKDMQHAEAFFGMIILKAYTE